MQLALVVATDFPDGNADTPLLLQTCQELDITASLEVWDNPAVQWQNFDAVYLYTPWDYTDNYDRFINWCRRVAQQTRLINSLDVVIWNSTKQYLLELQAKGLPVIPSVLFAQSATAPPNPFGDQAVVAKPLIDAGGYNAHHFASFDAALASPTLQDLHSHHDLLLQQYDDRITSEGEYSVTVIDGIISHVVRKQAAAGEFRVHDIHGGSIETAVLTPAMDHFCHQVLDALPWQPVYSRIDFVGSTHACLMELELVEPELFLRFDDQSANKLVAALAR